MKPVAVSSHKSAPKLGRKVSDVSMLHQTCSRSNRAVLFDACLQNRVLVHW